MYTSPPRFGVCSLSLGSNLYHDLPTKIRVASELGYDGIEIFIPDFEAFVTEVSRGEHQSLFPASLPSTSANNHTLLQQSCATAVHNLCESYNLAIPILQPLRNFENFASNNALEAALDAAEGWISLMPFFQTTLLLVCSNFIPGPHPITGPNGITVQTYLDNQVRAFKLLGERAAKYDVNIGYEPLAWGTVVDRWDQIWDVVKRVDMPNVGVILDSFNVLGNQYADPSHPTSIRQQPQPDLAQNMQLLSHVIPAEKIFFYQIADAHRPPVPLEEKSDAPARMTWSRASRLFPCEEEYEVPMPKSFVSASSSISPTGFLPVVDMTRSVLCAGYTGWWSLEVFNTSLNDADPICPTSHGERGIRGLSRLWEKVGGPSPQKKSGFSLAESNSAASSDISDDTDSTASSDSSNEQDDTRVPQRLDLLATGLLQSPPSPCPSMSSLHTVVHAY